MKRNKRDFLDDSSTNYKKIKSSPSVIISLDLTFNSELLIQKIRDVPRRDKFDKILIPIMNFTKENPTTEENLKTLPVYNLENNMFLLSIDLIRDGHYLFDQMHKLLEIYCFDRTINFLKINKMAKFFIMAIDSEVLLLRDVPSTLRRNRDFILSIVRNHPCELESVPKDMIDREIVMEAIKKEGSVLTDVSHIKEFIQDKELILLALNTCCELPNECFEGKDAEFIKKCAIEKNASLSYQVYIESGLVEDREFVLDSIKHNPNFYDIVCDELKSDIAIVLAYLEGSGNIKILPEKLRGNKKIALLALKNKAHGFPFLSKTLKDDRDVVMQALSKSTNIYNFVSDRLKQDREIAMQAMKTNCMVFSQLCEEFQNDREFVIELIEQDSHCVISFPRKYVNDREIILMAVSKAERGYFRASQELKQDREIVLKAVQSFASVFEHIPQEFRTDKEIVLTAVRQSGELFKFVPTPLCFDLEIVLEAVKQSKNALGFLRKEKFENYNEIVLTALKYDGNALGYVRKPDKELILTALTSKKKPKYHRVCDLITNDLLFDRDIILALLDANFKPNLL